MVTWLRHYIKNPQPMNVSLMLFFRVTSLKFIAIILLGFYYMKLTI